MNLVNLCSSSLKIEQDKSIKDDKELKIERKEPHRYKFISEIENKNVVYINTDDISEGH